MISYLKAHFNKALLLQYIVLILVIGVASALPLRHAIGRLNIGYDTFLPFIPEHSFKLTYQWTDRFNGIYTSNLYFVWVGILYVIQKMGASIYEAALTLQFGIFFLSGIGIYKTFNLYNKNSRYLSLIPAVAFIYSPYLLDFMLYQMGTVGIVWCIYFFLKFIHNKRFEFIDVLGISIALGTITDLPNPKYHFLLFVTFLFIIAMSIILKLLNWNDLKRNIKWFICLIALSSYLLVPFIAFAVSYSSYSTLPTNIKKDYSTMGETLDFGIAQTHKMIRLFHTPNLIDQAQKQIESPIFFLTYYILPLLVIGFFPLLILRKKGQEKNHYLLLYCCAIFFIFLSKGANPPFGLFYELMLRLQILAFLRTTAGLVVFAGVFYSLIIGLLSLELFSYKQFRAVTLISTSLLILLWGYPIWSGKYFYNKLERTSEKPTYGTTIPPAYFKAAKTIAGDPLDSKVDVYPSQEGYQFNSWGYYGIVYYPWLIKQPVISFSKQTHEGRAQSMVNVQYILHDKTATPQEYEQYILPSTKPVFTSEYLDLYRQTTSHFIPHIYVSSKNMSTNKVPTSYLNDQEKTELFGYFQLTNDPGVLLRIPQNITDKPIVEFKKINPSKYRVRLHKATGIFPIIFEENFHPLWSMYIKQYPSVIKTNRVSDLEPETDSYLASKSDRVRYQRDGSLSVMGTNYISKKIHGAIQNDNLDSSQIFETLLLQKAGAEHLKVNEYFNSWLINSQQLCAQTMKCIKNPDGSYEIELVIEFDAQKITDISVGISLLAFLGCVIHLSNSFIKKYKNK